VLTLWARTALRAFYGPIEVTADRPLPADRPTILAANHSNALADVAVLVANAPRFPRFLAAASWWDRTAARVLFRLGGVLPVERARERSGSMHNTSTFEACRDALARGEHIAIFPEGELNVGHGLLPIRTGAARIGLDAAIDGDVGEVAIVPVALVYEDRGRFRSSLLIHFGEPIELGDWVEAWRDDPVGAVRSVTDLLAARLAEVVDAGDGSGGSHVTSRAASMVLTSAVDDRNGRVSLADRSDLSRRLARPKGRVLGADGLEAAVAVHSRNLARLGFDDTHPLDPEPAMSQRVLELALLTPAAAVGALANAPVVLGAALLDRFAGREGWTATVQGVGGTFLFLATVAAELLAGVRRMPRRRAVLMVTATSVGGAASLRWLDRFHALRRVARVSRTERERRDELEDARRSRAELTRLVESIVGDSLPVAVGRA
jgi:1-acyl-sn-glycerol-3-phosphate acyltransferase